MATKITFTDDVGRIATAANADSSIRWHAYERTVGGATGIYVQREVNNVLEAEVLFIRDGSRPEVIFDQVSGKWLFFYEFNEQTWLVTADETDAPTTRISQLGTLIVHLRSVGTDQPTTGSTTERQDERAFGIAAVDAYASPLPPSAVAIASSPTPGFFRIRWTIPLGDASNLINQNVLGFNLFVKRLDNGALEKRNGALIPFRGAGPVVYEYETVATPGTYFIQQVDYSGLRQDVGRITAPYDTIESDGTTLPRVIEAFMGAKTGEGLQSEDLRFVYVDFTPIKSITLDAFPSHGPSEGRQFDATITFEFTTFYIQPVDTFPSHGPSEGLSAKLTLTGFGTIEVG